jgi:hypothetical protein
MIGVATYAGEGRVVIAVAVWLSVSCFARM